MKRMPIYFVIAHSISSILIAHYIWCVGLDNRSVIVGVMFVAYKPVQLIKDFLLRLFFLIFF